MFLVGYFILALGIGPALWHSGALQHVGAMWIGIGALATIGFGIMLSVSFGRPAISEETRR